MYDSELNKLLSELKRIDKQSKEDKKSDDSNLDFLLNMNSKNLDNRDKDLTLGQYLDKYNKVDKHISNEKQRRGANTGYEELLRDLEGNSEKYIEKKIDEDFEYREVKTLFSKQERGIEDIKSKDIFMNKSKERCNNVTERIKSYSNTKSQLIREEKMSPLKLERYAS